MRRALGSLLTSALLAAGLAAAPASAPASAAPAAAATAAPAAVVAPTTGVPTLPTSPLGDPLGANDWSCRPTAARPYPVILVHGTFGDRRSLLERLSLTVKNAGFCVFSLDYGNRGLNDIAASAAELKAYTERVLAATGAAKVSMVGHSQGGMMPRYYLKFLGGAAVVDDLVGLAPSNHGTLVTAGELNPISRLVGYACVSCVQQGTGSPFLTRLNAGDETPGDVSYTQVTTRNDEVVIPHTSGYLAAGPRTTNVTIQSRCPLALAEHLFLPSSTPALSYVVDALTRPGPASPTLQPRCS
ncbi:esterase/lipase family protein [Nocardioides litoris]|uniref:esterase/lipase family protein n=1 Tax=Nocardioides litoris TaxID=1926648 RepID=UPI001120035B|nr:alpha/beta fold hydrolase [Nocardioides litoris]